MSHADEIETIVSAIRQDGDALPAMLARLDDLTDRLRQVEHSRHRCPPKWRGMYPHLAYARPPEGEEVAS